MIEAVPAGAVGYDIAIDQIELPPNLPAALNEIGKRVMQHLQSYTNERRPPVKRGGLPREAHPGHWADVTRDLVSKYGWTVAENTLVLFNESDHAVYLEERDGFFVLRGILEPGGVFERILVEVIQEFYPDWIVEVTYGAR
jgi:hypothetical protein